MGNIQKFADILQKIYDSIDQKDWLSSIGTSLDTYLRDLIEKRNYFLSKSKIDLNDDNDVAEFLDKLSYRKNPSNKLGKIKQRIHFYELLGIFEWKDKNTYLINSDSLTNITYENAMNIFINEGIILLRSINLHGAIKTMHLPAIKIFTGFYIYSLLRIIGREEFDNLKLLLKPNVRSKIDQIDSQKKSQIKRNTWTLDNTYKYFFDNHFSVITLHDLEKIYSYIFIETQNYWYFNNENINKFLISSENIVKKIKKLYNERKFKDITDEEIKNALRFNFNNNLRKHSNDDSDIFLEINCKIDREFLESAHIIPISKIKSLCDQLIDKDEELLKKILGLLCSVSNGMLIPINYHNFYDNQYIDISRNEPKFILTEKGINSIASLKILGYTDNHYFKKNKYDEIIETIDKYQEISKGIIN